MLTQNNSFFRVLCDSQGNFLYGRKDINSLFTYFLGLERIVRILIERAQLTDGSYLNATDAFGQSALLLAARGDDSWLIENLSKK